MKTIKKKYRSFLRAGINRQNKSRLKNHDFTIICQNCTAGVIYHELNERFLTPTVNMFFKPSGFVRFCGDLQRYLDMEPVEVKNSGESFPVLALDDVWLYFNHAKTYEEAAYEWNRRKGRVVFDNICFMMAERDGCTYDDIKAFDSLPHKYKVCFVSRPMPEIKSAYYIPGTERNANDEHAIESLTGYTGRFSGKRLIDGFDYVGFLNSMLE